MKTSFMGRTIVKNKENKREGSLLSHNMLVSLLRFSVVFSMLICMPVLENSCLGNSGKSIKLFFLT